MPTTRVALPPTRVALATTRVALPRGGRRPRGPRLTREPDDGIRTGATSILGGIMSGVIWALAPTVLVGLAFWAVMRALVRADRSERKAYDKIEAEERSRRGMPRP